MKIVIIGNGMATDAFLESWGELPSSVKTQWEITVFGDETLTSAYNRIFLVDLLTGRKTTEKILLKASDWYSLNGITLKTGVRIDRIDSMSKTIWDENGNSTPYDIAVIAVGARPFIPPVPGVLLKGVHVLRTIEDVREVSERARKSRKAVVVGGGLLGLESARGLSDMGVAATVLHLRGWVMDQQLDQMGGHLLKKEIERMGIQIRVNTVLSQIHGIGGNVSAVELSTGEHLPADLVLISAGILPDTRLAISSGIDVNKGVLVKDDLMTSALDVYALGDVIEHRGHCYGLVIPLREQAKILVHNLTHGSEAPLSYVGTECSTALKVSGVSVISAGKILGGSGTEELVALDSHRGSYRKLIFRGDRLEGAIFVGDPAGSPRVLGLINSAGSALALREDFFGKSVSSALIEGDDKETVCVCHNVTRGTILAAVRTKGLKSRDEVAKHTKASTGCGSCSQAVTDLIARSEIGQKSVKASPATAVSIDNPPIRTLLSEYPPTYPKMLEIERIKKEGLGLDFDEIFKKDIAALSEDDFYRLKTYGICSQKHPGFFMVRIRIPGGRLSYDQGVELARLSKKYARGRVHISTRQNLELHWIRLHDMQYIWEGLDSVGLSTRSSCGHTMRNVMACPHGSVSPDALMDVGPIARSISDYFVQRSDMINPGLPNRLNILFSACPLCDPDVWINDIGFRVVPAPAEQNQAESFGFELWAGGSLGAHPVLGFRLKEFIPLREALPACQAIFEIYTKHGNRNKAKSRLKWLVEQWGKEKFSTIFDQVFQGKKSLPENKEFRFAEEKQSPRPFPFSLYPSRILEGCLPQKQRGKVLIPVDVPLGELASYQLKALSKITRRYGDDGILQLTKEQNIEIQGITERHGPSAIHEIRGLGLSPFSVGTNPNIVACPGTEFCVLAVTDAQGVARSLLHDFKSPNPKVMELMDQVTVAISGCPNSCSKHQVADIGLSGAMTVVGDDRRYAYSVYLGGRMGKEVRLGEVVLKGLTEEMVLPVFETLLECIDNRRIGVETFQNIVDRVGVKMLGKEVETLLESSRPHIWEKIRMECQDDIHEEILK